MIGEEILDCVKGECPREFREKWGWKGKVDDVVTEDGSRGGRMGMILREEMEKGKGSSRL